MTMHRWELLYIPLHAINSRKRKLLIRRACDGKLPDDWKSAQSIVLTRREVRNELRAFVRHTGYVIRVKRIKPVDEEIY